MNLSEKKRLIANSFNAQEARSIIELVTGFDSRQQLLKRDYILTNEQEALISSILKKREQGYPLQYILGKWSFMDNDYFVGEGVLIPRDDTEVVVRSVLPYLKDKENPTVIDLCSGSGIIAITLKKLFPKATVYALELSERAMPYLEKNIKGLCPEVRLCKGDLNVLYKDFQDNYFDLIISNPPYIKSEDLATLQQEVRSEPVMALDGGQDGLVFYKNILDRWSSKLKQGGALAFELGEEEFLPVKALMEEKDFENIVGYKDLGGIYRAINGTVKK
jgi:release factor glutamine methyltransferase